LHPAPESDPAPVLPVCVQAPLLLINCLLPAQGFEVRPSATKGCLHCATRFKNA
jgi:hypothetical protein